MKTMVDSTTGQQEQKKKIYPSLSSFSQPSSSSSASPVSHATAQAEKKPVSQESRPPASAPKQDIKPAIHNPDLPDKPAQKPSYVSTPRYQQPIQQSPKPIQSSWKDNASSSAGQSQPSLKSQASDLPSKPSYESTPRSSQPSWKSNYNSSYSGSSPDNKRGIPFRLYKATKSNTGSAMSLDLNAEKQSIFIDISKQVGEQKFDWENKITMKLSITDIGKMLAVLTGSLKNSKLYHDPSKGQYESAKDTRNTVLEFSKGISFGYTLKASEQGTNGAVVSIVVPISEDEGEVIRVLLEASIRKIYGW